MLLAACGTVRIPYDMGAGGDSAKPVDGLIGVGAFVSKDGHLVTSRTFVGLCDHVTANDQKFETVATSTRHDLVLLKGPNPSQARITLRANDLPVQGEAVTIFDGPEPSAELQVTRQTGSVKASMLNALLFNAKQPIRHPGGPVVGDDGLVIATVAQSLSGSGYVNGVPAGAIADFLRKNNVPVAMGETVGGPNNQAIVPLQCWKKGAAPGETG